MLLYNQPFHKLFHQFLVKCGACSSVPLTYKVSTDSKLLLLLFNHIILYVMCLFFVPPSSINLVHCLLILHLATEAFFVTTSWYISVLFSLPFTAQLITNAV